MHGSEKEKGFSDDKKGRVTKGGGGGGGEDGEDGGVGWGKAKNGHWIKISYSITQRR